MSFIALLWGLNAKALCRALHTMWNGADPQWILFPCRTIISSTIEIWRQIMVFFLFYFIHLVIFISGLHFPPVLVWMEPKKFLSLFSAFWIACMPHICIPFLLRFPSCIFLAYILWWHILITGVCVYLCACMYILGERLSLFSSIF